LAYTGNSVMFVMPGIVPSPWRIVAVFHVLKC